jgi:hypothetical protein
MKSFKNYLNESKKYELSFGRIDESGAGINRVISTLDSGVDFAMITASRGSNSNKENRANNNKLIKEIRSDLHQKVGAYKLIGHLKECSEPLKDNETIKDCKGNITNALEETWLVIKPNDVSSEDFEKAIQNAAKKYNQDAYVIRREGKLELKGKDGSSWGNLGKANKDSLSKGFEKVLGVQGYSELAKDRKHGRVNNIVFESYESFDISIAIPDDTNSSHQLFNTANILY